MNPPLPDGERTKPALSTDEGVRGKSITMLKVSTHQIHFTFGSFFGGRAVSAFG